MSKKEKEKTIKDYLGEPWDSVLLPKMSKGRILFVFIAAVIAFFGYITQRYVLDLSKWYSYLCYYLAGWMIIVVVHSYFSSKEIVLKKHSGKKKDDDFISLKELWSKVFIEKNKKDPVSVKYLVVMVLTAAVSVLPILFLYVIEFVIYILVKLKIIHFSKDFIVILIALLASLYLLTPIILAMGKLNDVFPGLVNENNAENILVFFSLIVTYFVSKLFLYIWTKLFDSEYKHIPSVGQPKYLDDLYTETKLVYTVLLVFANVAFKVFMVYPIDEKLINAFFISSAIIALFNTCVTTWKGLEADDPKRYIA